MSPAVLVFLPFALLLLMAKGAGANSETPKKEKTSSGKIMGILTEQGDFIPFSALTDHNVLDSDHNGIVLEQNGKRYFLAAASEQN
ncbi:hypothetical protein Lepto7375DRAFT_2098 [Leptolyngbya sp. PCC 7375]|nr:hypothetical protein Lepto7375DRAFT_2098 [Leptolyngbya sp. PCC 7375]